MSTKIDVFDSKALAEDGYTPIPENTELLAQVGVGSARSEKKILSSTKADSDKSTPKGSNEVETVSTATILLEMLVVQRS